jgi:glycosyltransferase involved in cell wall biosynthesis
MEKEDDSIYMNASGTNSSLLLLQDFDLSVVIALLEKHCDGIIVLDDESTDNTYELIQSEKLIVKAKKKRIDFNDKQNRNILLDIAYFFRSEWFIFIDADERFDERFVDLPKVMRLPVDVVGLWIANLWDSMETYRIDMGDSNQISQNGLWFRWRMFRNRGRMQITSTNTLHFNSVPYLLNLHISQSLLLHLGYLNEDRRVVKYAFYMKEDNLNLFGYYDILKKDIHVKNINLLTEKDLVSDFPTNSPSDNFADSAQYS